MAGLVIGLVYLRVATTKHIAASTVLIERLAPSLAAGTGDTSAAAVVDAQVEVIRSSDVLRLAETNGNFAGMTTFAHVHDPLALLRTDLRIDHPVGGNVLTVAFPSPNDAEAIAIVDEVIKSYQSYQSDRRTQKSRELAASIDSTRRGVTDQLASARKDLNAFDTANGPATGAPATQQVSSMADALTKAQLETFTTHRAYDEAVADAGSVLQGLNDQQLEQALQQAGANAPDSSEMVSQEVYALSQQLAELRKTYAENHPAVQRATQRLRQIRLLQVAGTRQRWAASQAREADLRKAFEQLQTTNSTQSTRAGERERLTGEVTRLQARLDELDKQVGQVLLATTAGSLNIEVLAPAEIDRPGFPALPRPAPTLATTSLVGLVIGGLLALIGEYREVGSLRHVVPVRDTVPSADRAARTLGVPVLALVPESDDHDDQETPVTWSAQFDPFGPVANAVRTMRRALEVDGKLPATIVVTAASDQQGTTNIAINLATTIAREGRKVLIVDLNFRVPAVASALEVDGSRGLTELVAGGDPLELIRTTSIARLDVLGAGVTPADAAAMLNDERFIRLMSTLTTAYDHVIFDAAPLSRGDDARIVASVCDATVLISRPSPAALRRAAGARDLLLTVGANLVGVTLSRVSASAAAGGATSDIDRTI